MQPATLKRPVQELHDELDTLFRKEGHWTIPEYDRVNTTLDTLLSYYFKQRNKANFEIEDDNLDEPAIIQRKIDQYQRLTNYYNIVRDSFTVELSLFRGPTVIRFYRLWDS